MKKNFCKIVFCVDRSGSMTSIASDIIGGFNAFIEEQKKTPGECIVSLYQFDDIFEEVYKNISIQYVSPLTDKTFQPRGMTALYDAVGKTVNSIGIELNKLDEDQRPEKVIVVIITDGGENSSHEFNSQKVSEMVKHQTSAYNWQFNYIGANQDSWSAGQTIGITGSYTSNYVSTGLNKSISTSAVFNTLSQKATAYRSCLSTDMSFTKQEQELQDELVKTNVP